MADTQACRMLLPVGRQNLNRLALLRTTGQTFLSQIFFNRYRQVLFGFSVNNDMASATTPGRTSYATRACQILPPSKWKIRIAVCADKVQEASAQGNPPLQAEGGFEGLLRLDDGCAYF